MIDVILECDGWTKTVSIDEHYHKSGFVTMMFRRPMSLMVVPDDVPNRAIDIATAKFWRTNRWINGMPVYREEHST